MKVTYHPEAEAELQDAARYYEQRVPELGGRSLDAANLAVESIVRSPGLCQVVESDIRLCLMQKFPYAIYFRVFPRSDPYPRLETSQPEPGVLEVAVDGVTPWLEIWILIGIHVPDAVLATNGWS